MSGILFAAFMFFGYQILLLIFPEIFVRWWYLKNLSGIVLFKVPMEEILWSLAFGFLIGPSYEFFMGLKSKEKDSGQARMTRIM